jgi:hypothetical protein
MLTERQLTTYRSRYLVRREGGKIVGRFSNATDAAWAMHKGHRREVWAWLDSQKRYLMVSTTRR